MSENKTQKTNASVIDFLNSIPDEKKRQDCLTVFEIMRQVTGLEPKMWGASIVGFGDVHYKYASGREGDWFKVGFSPRKQNLTLYIMDGFPRYQSLLADLGKHKTGVSCLYINKLADIDLDVLKEMIGQSVGTGEKPG
ncbi:MAG: DUF1801 domain-containing protein [Anaerolineae bacterium]|nr:DUF1801 domain-containing protein [Anaerolineae bacterium]